MGAEHKGEGAEGLRWQQGEGGICPSEAAKEPMSETLQAGSTLDYKVGMEKEMNE